MIFKKIILVSVCLVFLGGFSMINTPEASATTGTTNVEALQAQINQLLAQLTQLQQQLAAAQGMQQTAWCHNFNANLRVGDKGNEVANLHTALQKDGVWNVTGFSNTDFDEETASYVVVFQEKYKSEILTPLGLKHGTGYLGASTRAKLNKLYGCQTNCKGENEFCGGIAGFQCCSGLKCVLDGTYPDAGGTCKKETKDCISEGQQGSYFKGDTCCAGLEKLSNSSLASDGICAAITDGSFICSKCGNGICGSGENSCNCSEDCKEKKYITVLSPNGGEKWEVGKTYEIKWLNSNNSLPINIVLKDVYGLETSIGGANSGATSYSWTIPVKIGSIALGGQNIYKIGVYLATDSTVAIPGYYDISDNYFSITSATSSCTDSDKGKDYYVKGELNLSSGQSFKDQCLYNSQTKQTDGLSEYFCDSSTLGKWNHITVKCSGGCVDNACLGTAISPICTDQDGTDIYTKSIAQDEYGTGQGDCCVVGSGGGTCVDKSDYVKEGICKTSSTVGEWTFTEQVFKCANGCQNGACIKSVVTPTITLVSPNGGEKLMQGQTYQVVWQRANFDDEVAINLIDYTPGSRYGMQYGITNGMNIRTVAGQISFSWTISTSIPAGDYYKVSIGSSSVTDFSDNYFSIASATSSCTDSDGGKDYNTKGIVTYAGSTNYVPDATGGHSYTDKCGGGAVNEFYCSGNTLMSISYACPNGCSNGACLPAINSFVTVALDPSNPPSANISSGDKNVPFIKIKIVNSYNRGVSISSLAVNLKGTAEPSDIGNIYWYEDSTLLGTSYFGSFGSAYRFSSFDEVESTCYSSCPGIFTIPANSTKIVTVSADISSGAKAGITAAFSFLQDFYIYTVDRLPITATFPITGNTMTIINP